MLDSKIFELRDFATFIPVVATKLKTMPQSTISREEWLLRRAGFNSQSIDTTFVLLARAEGGKAYYDPNDWNDRTFTAAHRHICENWDNLPSGALIDVRFVLGETVAPCFSEYLGV